MRKLLWLILLPVGLFAQYQTFTGVKADSMRPKSGTTIYIGGIVAPITTLTYDLGTSALLWDSLYIRYAIATGNSWFKANLDLGVANSYTSILKFYSDDDAFYQSFSRATGFTANRNVALPDYDGTLAVSGAAQDVSFGNLTISGLINADTLISPIGPVVVTDSLSVQYRVGAASLAITGASTFGGSATFNEYVTFNDTLQTTSYTLLGGTGIIITDDGYYSSTSTNDFAPDVSGSKSLGVTSQRWDKLFLLGNADIGGTLLIDSIITDQTTANIFNATATTVNAFGAATTLNIAASTGTTTINNDLTVGDELTVSGSGTSAIAGPFTALTVMGTQYSTAPPFESRSTSATTRWRWGIFSTDSSWRLEKFGLNYPIIVAPATGSITFAGDIAVNGDDITSDADLTITPAGGDIIIPSGVSLDVAAAVADTSAFTTTETRKAIYISGALSTDKYNVSHRNANGDDTLPVASDQLSYYAKADSLIVLRAVGTTSGQKFSFSRFK